MLVYANHVPIRSSDGLRDPLGPVADWVSRKMRKKGSAEDLLRGIETKNAQGWELRSISSVDQFPHFAAVELVHPDQDVSGRRWHSEIGLHQRHVRADVELSVLVHTSEISARVTALVTPGAPTFVGDLLTRCQLSSAAVGGVARSLDDGDAEAFRHVVLDPARTHPYVVVSPLRDGSYAVDVTLLQQLLIGIAELVVIPPTADTFWLARGVGEQFVPYRGAVKIIHTRRDDERVDVRTFTEKELLSNGANRAEAARELFSWVLHRTNLTLSWKHVSPTRVREEQLRRELTVRRAQAAASGNAAEFTAFLEECLLEQESATRNAVDARLLSESRYDELLEVSDQVKRALEAKIEALHYQLGQASASQDDSPYRTEDIEAVATAVAAAIERAPTPEQSLVILEHLFPERVKILPEAWTSARDSDSFKYRQKLFALLFALLTEYWSSLSAGKPDQEARKVLGAAYAPKESEGVSTNKGARKRRTFSYDGEPHVMEKHLKIGVKDSSAETIRVHFEWFADRKRIVIGHCGPHIPFS